jgi:hypothetical protein
MAYTKPNIETVGPTHEPTGLLRTRGEEARA